MFYFNENYINNSLETLIQQKRKSPPVRVKSDASHLLDKHPRPLDHRGFPICCRSLIQVIHIVVTELWLLILFTRCHLCIPSVQCSTTVHLFCTSIWMVTSSVTTIWITWISDLQQIRNPLWSSSLGCSSGKWEVLGSTPTRGDFLFYHISVSKELFI